MKGFGIVLDFFDGLSTEESRGPEKEDQNQDGKRDRILVRGPLAPVHKCFDRSQNEPTECGSGNVADAAEDRRDKRSEPRHDSHEGIDRGVVDRVKDSARSGEG